MRLRVSPTSSGGRLVSARGIANNASGNLRQHRQGLLKGNAIGPHNLYPQLGGAIAREGIGQIEPQVGVGL
jgi:hypothetical protein